MGQVGSRKGSSCLDVGRNSRAKADDLSKEAEKHKLKGNSLMASRDYKAALEEYSCAIDLCPDGPQSHVYFSNRATALCYLEHYKDAEADSAHSLSLVPTYGKAHARLGLSKFFMGDYALPRSSTIPTMPPANLIWPRSKRVWCKRIRPERKLTLDMAQHAVDPPTMI